MVMIVPGRRHRHRVRGTTYTEIARGTMQSREHGFDGEPVVIYVADGDGSVNARLASEFDDGRFEPIDDDADIKASAGAVSESLVSKQAQVAQQCLVVAHLADALVRVHRDYARIITLSPTLVDQVGERTASFMEKLGNMLNAMDAVDPAEDKWTDAVFEMAHEMFPQPAPAAAQMAAALAAERARCADIVQAARNGDVDTDLRTIIHFITSGQTLAEINPKEES